MKIKREDFKALIKECLIEILSDGLPMKGRQISAPVRETIREVPRRAPPPDVQLPDGIPGPLQSLFADTGRRASSQMYQDSTKVDKQAEVLSQMAPTWETMTFGAPLPSRAANPSDHRDVSPISGDDDGFDPYEVVKASRNGR
jgi:hypothetical protein